MLGNEKVAVAEEEMVAGGNPTVAFSVEFRASSTMGISRAVLAGENLSLLGLSMLSNVPSSCAPLQGSVLSFVQAWRRPSLPKRCNGTKVRLSWPGARDKMKSGTAAGC